MEVFAMSGSIVIDTPVNGSVTTSLVCRNCLLTNYGRDFGINLVSLPLIQLDVILGMNWLEFNHVHINYFDKLVLFLESKENVSRVHDRETTTDVIE